MPVSDARNNGFRTAGMAVFFSRKKNTFRNTTNVNFNEQRQLFFRKIDNNTYALKHGYKHELLNAYIGNCPAKFIYEGISIPHKNCLCRMRLLIYPLSS